MNYNMLEVEVGRMTKSPTWLGEELMLALELYLSKGMEWLGRISDRTPEIVTLSYILQNLDYHTGQKPEKFRSVGSVRMKLSNFKAVDSRYGKSSLSNISKSDREVWNKYNQQLSALRKKCTEIVENHYCGEPREDVREYFSRLEVQIPKQDFPSLCRETINQINKLRKWCEANNRPDVVGSCDQLAALLVSESSKGEYREHAGVNQERLSPENKIGVLVRTEMRKLITEGRLTKADFELLKSEEWCRRTFHIGHPLIREIDDSVPFKIQLRDENGYLRYWRDSYRFNDQSFVLCKEWFESNRKYFVSWLKRIKESSYSEQVEHRVEAITNILKFVQVIDSKRVSVSVLDIKEQFPDEENIDALIDKLFEKGILAPYQGSLRDFIVDDYELLHNIIQTPYKYIEGLML